MTVDTSPDSPIAEHAAVVVVSEEFAARSFDSSDPEMVMSAFTRRCHGLIIVTRGAKPLLYTRAGGAVSDFAPFRVEARDTTGAGDSFRAGIIYGLLRGYNDARLIETASAVAALVSQHVPGVLNSPTVEELEGFLAANR